MGLNVCAFRCKIGVSWVDYNDEESISYWADERLMELFKEKGSKIEDKEKNFNSDEVPDEDCLDVFVDYKLSLCQIEEIIEISKQRCEKINLQQKYSNETKDEYLKRWGYIKKTLEEFRDRVDWEKEYVAIYISC